MAETALLSNLGNPLALAGLSLIVPIILLYLLKPKPKLIMFPSTMFIRFIEKNKRFISFLQKFIHDPLLFMQILIITLFVFALADPFYNNTQEEREEASVAFVLDCSASMQAADASPNRFEAAQLKAGDIMSKLNENDDVSVVVAENIPAVIATGKAPKDAWASTSKLAASDTTTNLGDAIMLARDMVINSDRKKLIYVISDFAGGGGLDPQLARKIALASGIGVEFLKVGSGGVNAGIVSLEARRSQIRDDELYLTTAVRNYRAADIKANLRVLTGEGILDIQDKTLAPGEEGFFYFKPNISSSQQMVKVELTGGDDLQVDDVAYAYVPAVKPSKVLLLTSEGSDKYLRLMLESLASTKKVEFTYAVPPVVPDVRQFDVIVLGNARSENILPGMFRDIKNQVQKGGSLVVIATENLPKITDDNLWSILPVDMLGTGSRESQIKVVEEHDMLTDVVFDNVVVKKYYNMRERDNQTKTLTGSNLFDNPLIAYSQYGEGYAMYMGINSEPDWSNLYYSSSFPIFWSQMIKYLTRLRGPAGVTSLQTGEYLQEPGALQVQMPSGGKMVTQSVFLDKAGIYEVTYPDRTEQVAVNLLDGVESNITGADLEDMTKAGDYTFKYKEVEVRVDLFRNLVALMLVALVVELYFYRRRGLL